MSELPAPVATSNLKLFGIADIYKWPMEQPEPAVKIKMYHIRNVQFVYLD